MRTRSSREARRPARARASDRRGRGAPASARPVAIAASTSPFSTWPRLPVPATVTSHGIRIDIIVGGDLGRGRSRRHFRAGRWARFSRGQVRWSSGAAGAAAGAEGAAAAAPAPAVICPSRAPGATVSPSFAVISDSTPAEGAFDFEGNLVGLEFEQGLVGLHGIAGLFEPAADGGLRDGFAESGNTNFCHFSHARAMARPFISMMMLRRRKPRQQYVRTKQILLHAAEVVGARLDAAVRLVRSPRCRRTSSRRCPRRRSFRQRSRCPRSVTRWSLFIPPDSRDREPIRGRRPALAKRKVRHHRSKVPRRTRGRCKLQCATRSWSPRGDQRRREPMARGSPVARPERVGHHGSPGSLAQKGVRPPWFPRVARPRGGRPRSWTCPISAQGQLCSLHRQDARLPARAREPPDHPQVRMNKCSGR